MPEPCTLGIQSRAIVLQKIPQLNLQQQRYSNGHTFAYVYLRSMSHFLHKPKKLNTSPNDCNKH